MTCRYKSHEKHSGQERKMANQKEIYERSFVIKTC